MLVINHHANVVEVASTVAEKKMLNQILSDLFIGSLLCDSYCQDNYFLGEHANDVLSLFTQEKEAEAISTPISAHVHKMWSIMHTETDDSDEESESVSIGTILVLIIIFFILCKCFIANQHYLSQTISIPLFHHSCFDRLHARDLELKWRQNHHCRAFGGKKNRRW